VASVGVVVPRRATQWHVLIIRLRVEEAMKFLDEAEYAQLAEQFQDLPSK